MEKNVGTEFMEQSKVKNCSPSAASQNQPVPPIQQQPAAGTKIIELPSPDVLEDKQVNFLELVELRTSVRNYRPEVALTLKELSYLLWCTQGVKILMSNGMTRRNVPSAGGRHAFETYLLINNVEGLERGLYRFLALEHVLIPVDTSQNIGSQLEIAFMKQPQIGKSAVTFIWAAMAERMEYAYAERAYRYLHLDAGHVCQNLYLAAQTILCGSCAIGHFDDDMLNELLNLDGEKQFVIYAATVGR